MKTLKKVSIIMLAFLSIFFLIFGITFSGGLKNAKANGVGNYQNYKGGKVKFSDWLFTDSRVLTIEEANQKILDRGVAFNTTLEQKIQSGEYNQEYNDYLETLKFEDEDYSTLVDDIKIYNGTDNAGTDYVPCTPVKNKKNLSAGEVTGIFMENGVDANGNVRYAFAYVGIPYNDALGVAVSSSNPVPAVVCIQGAGGTAFSEWVTYWMKKGYAAISIDTEGGVPEKVNGVRGKLDTHSELSSNFDGLNMGKSNPAYQDCIPQNRIEDMWFYQAVSSAIAGTTFLRSQELIDNDKIAVTGISYGSYLTCLTTAYDGRYCAAVPVYGSLEQHEGDTWFANNTKLYPLASELWDSNDCLKGNKVPILYYTSNADPHFSIESTTISLSEVPNSRAYIHHEFPHSHWSGIVDEDPSYAYSKVVYDFIGSYCYSTTAFGTIYQQPTKDKTNISLEFGNSFSGGSLVDTNDYYYTVVEMPAGQTLKNAKVYYTNSKKLINNDTAANTDVFCKKNEFDADGDGFYNGDYFPVGWETDLGKFEGVSGKYNYAATRLGWSSLYGDYYYQYRTIWNYFSAEITDLNDPYRNLYLVKVPSSRETDIDNCNFFYFNFNEGELPFTSEVIAKNKIPDIFYFLYREDDASVQLTYDSDQNGFATLNDGFEWKRYLGDGQVNQANGSGGGIYMDPNNTAGGYTWPVIANSNYGSKETSYSKGVTTLKLNNNHLMNYKSYDVFEPIEFYFKASDLSSAYFTFSLFTDVENGMLAGLNSKDVTAKYFSDIDDKLKTQDYAHRGSASLIAPRLAITGATASTMINGFNAEKGSLTLETASWSNETATLNAEKVNQIDYFNEFVKVKILVLEDKTEIYINESLVYTTLDVQRTSFKWYKAYLGLSAINENSSNVEIQFSRDGKETINKVYNNGTSAFITKNIYDYKVDKNGFATEIQNGNTYYVDGTQNTVLSSGFGVKDTKIENDYTVMTITNGGYLVNFNALSVNKEIIIKYSFSAPEGENVGSNYILSLFSNVNDAMRANANGWSSNTGAKLVMQGSNSEFDGWGNDGWEDMKYKLAVHDGTGAEQGKGGHSKYLFGGETAPIIPTDNWKEYTITIKISIEEDKTTVSVNDENLVVNTVNQSSFPQGEAYLYLCANTYTQNLTFKMQVSQPFSSSGEQGGNGEGQDPVDPPPSGEGEGNQGEGQDPVNPPSDQGGNGGTDTPTEGSGETTPSNEPTSGCLSSINALSTISFILMGLAITFVIKKIRRKEN